MVFPSFRLVYPGVSCRYYINVIIFIIRVLKLLLMKYRSVLFLLILAALIAVPASAYLTKVDAKAQVFVGETGLDIGSALNGCRQIAWWPKGSSTDAAPEKVISITDEEMRKFDIDPAVYSNYTGFWYSYDKKPSIVVFEVVQPEFDLRVWDLDHDKDVTGESVPVSTRVTYRIVTNLYSAFNMYMRPERTNLDGFMEVTLTSPTGNNIPNIYTGSAGAKDTVVLPLETAPFVTESPFDWSDGGRWDHTARAKDGTVLYPLGTYTFTASQDLDGMASVYGADSPVVATGPRTVTFVADEVTTATATETATLSATETATVIPDTTLPETAAPSATVTEPAAQESGTAKTTWTSAPLSPVTVLCALCISAAFALSFLKRSR